MCSLTSKLPEEIISKKGINCKKTINGNKASNNFLLCVKLNKTAKDVEEKLLKWLLNKLDKLSEKTKTIQDRVDGRPVIINKPINFNIISRIKDNDAKYTDDNYSAPIKLNTILFAIHIDNNSATDELCDHDEISMNLTIPYDNSYTFNPQQLADCLINEPEFIDRIGVNAISSKKMMDWWMDMIDVRDYEYDSKGKGLGKHTMFSKTEYGWIKTTEKSTSFKWVGY